MIGKVKILYRQKRETLDLDLKTEPRYMKYNDIIVL